MRHAFMLLLAALACLSFAGERAVDIREAAYLFEMKGEAAEAKKILEDISKAGEQDDRASADFLLAKIQDLEGNDQTAAFFYRQSQLETEIPAQAFWAAERLAMLERSPEKLLRSSIALPSPIAQVLPGDEPRILLGDKNVYEPSAGRYLKLPADVPETAHLLYLTAAGAWWRQGKTLHFSPTRPIFSPFTYEVQKRVVDFSVISPYLFAFIDGEELVLLDGSSERFRTQARYRDCAFLKEQDADAPIVLNCPDNALHFISREDGSEFGVISMLDPITTVHLDRGGVLLLSGDVLWCYSHGNLTAAQWRMAGFSVGEIVSFGHYYAILESSGTVSLLNKRTGEVRRQLKTNAASMLPLATGMLGLISRSGAIFATDTLLNPLWSYHLDAISVVPPWVAEGKLYYASSPDTIKVLNALYYGNFSGLSPVLSQQLAYDASKAFYYGDLDLAEALADSALGYEPGNSVARYVRARYLEEVKAPVKEKEHAWAEAVRVSVDGLSAHQTEILNHYAKIIGARFVRHSSMSPSTVYPSFFAYKRSLVSLDPASRKLVCLNAETGALNWEQDVGRMESAPVTSHKDNLLALGSGFSLRIFNLDKPAAPKNMEMAGKIFQIAFSSDAIYVSMWNGFLAKIILSDLRQAWSRKIGANPFFVIPRAGDVTLVSLDGSVQQVLGVSGQLKGDEFKLQAEVLMYAESDSLLAFVTSDNRVMLFSSPEVPVVTISLGGRALSAEILGERGDKLLVSLANNELKLYSVPSGEQLWRYKGKGSVFGKFVVRGDTVWIDQKDELAGISIETGKLVARYPVSGGAGTPFVSQNSLYSVSSQGLIYAFDLH